MPKSQIIFFHERTDSVVVHALTKEDTVPAVDINRAIARKTTFSDNPFVHTFKGDIDDV